MLIPYGLVTLVAVVVLAVLVGGVVLVTLAHSFEGLQ